MMNQLVRGLYTALLTPLLADRIDFASLERLLENQISAGVDGVVILGTTGEYPTISPEERKDLIKKSIEIISGRMHVCVGASSNCTKTAIELAQQSEKLGADSVLVVTPYYNKPTQVGMFEHYKAINNSIGIPIILYNNPGRACVNLSDEVIVKLAELKNIKALKDSTGDLNRVLSLRHMLDENGLDLLQFSGEDMNVLAFCAHGGVGCISVSSNVIPSLCVKLLQLVKAEEHHIALDLQTKLYPFHKAMFCQTSPIPVKYAAYSLDLLASHEVRLPLDSISENAKKEVLNAINHIQMLL